jgi:DNA-binding NtrC family response regulator
VGAFAKAVKQPGVRALVRYDGSSQHRMRYQIVFLHEAQAFGELAVESLVPRGMLVQSVELSRESFASVTSVVTLADLIIGFARFDASGAIEAWRRIASRFLNKLWLAILPRDIDGNALKSASELADDFVLWPSPPEEVAQRIRRLLGGKPQAHDSTVLRLLHEIGFAQLVGEDPAFLRALETIPLLAASAAPVLITGETGTGKEFSAQAIHYLGPKRHSPFVAVDCGAIPDQVFENEMFGHVRGGYTDAHSDQKGLAEFADGGTLFLDEINSLSPAAQAKLLRFLQEGKFKPLGGSKFVQVNVRIIAATNQDLETCVRKGQFRADLFYRLNVLRLLLPPLRERPLDIPLLSKHFLDALERSGEGKSRTFSSSALRKLRSHSWPGNVRELHNVVRQAAVLATGPQILPEHVLLPDASDGDPCGRSGFHAERELAIAAFERNYVEQLLRNCGGNVSEAARQAGKNRRSIGRLMKKYNIDRKAAVNA